MGLRETKKAQTRQAISDTATRLFLDRGFEPVTIAEIAAAAQVAKMTVTNYFPRKEDLALDHHEVFAASLARTVRDRRRGDSALAALRREHLAAVGRRDAVAGFSGPEFAELIAGSPTLGARLRELHEQREAALAEVLAAETGARDDTPVVVAAVLGAVHRTLFHQVLDLTRAGTGADETAAVVARSARRAFALLKPSLGEYAVRVD
ncbi:TetR/AcrR family transcriptional regulator [Actinocatenispora rupis]|uniref:TetR family transcriptional regulator n=1 Tax=Actinocatenispora rupis TaxID=519421 RepID=A0A8J3IYJ0_9ACTN|nr:TetR/AcrR family transcriptional regulator [Actinocatenispora rupis]GID11003.1 TetR family transcriptional regulator [Actinocatenispora rupis]